MKHSLSIGFMLAVFQALGAKAWADAPKPSPAPAAVYRRPDAPLEARVEDLLAKLTQPEKISLLAFGSGDGSSRLDLPAIPRLGVPALRTCDAPEGVRDGQSTAFPMEVVMASTWDPALVNQVGAAIGQEARLKNRQVVYGPCANMDRTPQSGRTFENFSEDPYLSSRLTVSYIEGMQSQNVAACVKHFICNDQERDRDSINAVVDERTFHEIYLPPFQAAIQEAHAWALMSSFNRLNGTWMSENGPLLNGLLRTQWGWDGVVIPDWSSIHQTAASANAGSDIEMPNPNNYAPGAVGAALANGKITQSTLDDLVRPILRTIIRTSLLDSPPPAHAPGQAEIDTPAHRALALKAAQEGITLLKNEGHLLPLDRTAVKSVAVIGPNAADTQLGGRWSADVSPFYRVSVLDGIKKAAGDHVTVAFAQGCPRTGAGSASDLNAAAALAAKADVAIVVVGTDNNYEGEALDPPDLHLPGDQEKLIQAVAAANKRTIVILNGGTPYLTDAWLPQVSGLVDAWYAGQETGNAVAGILFGDVDPSGKLPDTFAHRREDYPDWGNYPGSNGVVTYAEGVYIGYRHFDKRAIAPMFPFGFGLSYTSFGYGGLKIPHHDRRDQATTISVTVQNTGARAGDEIAQLYIEPVAPKIDRPVRELKGFQRVSLLPGEKKTLSFPLDARSFAYWDVKTHAWQTDPGTYVVEVGSSSRDIRVKEAMTVR